jgi:hypothetical protein
MGEEAARAYWDGTGLVLLVVGFLLAPFAWLLDLQISYSMDKWACENDAREVLVAMPLGSLAIIAAGSWMCWSCWQRLRHDADEPGGRVIDRSYALAVSGLALNALFGLLILVSLAGRVVLSPCE